MSSEGKGIRPALVVAIAVVVAFAAFLLGRYSAMRDARPVTLTVVSSKDDLDNERELNIRLNLSELDGMTVDDGPIYVFGHRSPDSDSVCGSIAFARLLCELGYDARPAAIGNINNETKFILDSAGVEAPQTIEDVSGENVVLIDHSDVTQSADGIDDSNIVAIIDHHGDGTVVNSTPLLYDGRPFGSTCTIIWLHYRNYGVSIDPATAEVLMGGILSDTNNLKSESTTTADREAVALLSKTAGVDDVDAYYQNLFKASISYDNMTDEEIFLSDIKIYEGGDKRFAIASINAYDEDGAKDMAKRMSAVLPAQAKALGVDYVFALISVFHDDLSFNYLVPADEASSEVAKAAIGEISTFDGLSYVIKPGIGRKQVLVPAISNVLNSYPKE